MNILLLQGPMGPFFQKFAKQLEADGHRVIKVNFNGGDIFYSRGLKSVSFRGQLDQLSWFLKQLIAQHHIDVVYGYGDCRDHHRVATKVCADQSVPVYYFEDGYLRPDYITCELGGVNDNSSLPRDPEFYRKQPKGPLPKTESIGFDFYQRILHAVAYYFFSFILRRQFAHYSHHRSFCGFYEARCWIKAWLLKHPQRWLSGRRLAGLQRKWGSRFYLMPLQIKDDSQIRFHSDFPDVASSIKVAVSSFAKHAPTDTALVIKHHPMDRGHSNYQHLIKQLVKEHKLGDRVVYIYDGPNPWLLRKCLGVVLINSTMGISALVHGKKVKALGRAIYDMPGLCFQGELSGFWAADFEPDRGLFERFRLYLVKQTQLNQNFYKPLDSIQVPGLSGIEPKKPRIPVVIQHVLSRKNHLSEEKSGVAIPQA
ncbi:capsule biosynthesis protein [Pseudobacteriovorax antillogorgiicola]|uniref:Capsular polysaccharide export protein n=1 Tax=Pseudobacteriovorax antillogorgiicola TaxID=1513793 RepID=A0A1Y6C1N2_9BACT|nr:capsular biosynthesis protein [Pseudobacteriovorax antillogorgiicola]TCS50631.1 capsular polysaccharide export protein [Pseudobacteriovorax antillogorgiicola]SMF39476.1 capsular polysaccharide export protein [Pseudobacteriovorax antillogorgiicola]